MRTRTITVTFETNAADDVVEEIAEHMRWQLDSLVDSTHQAMMPKALEIDQMVKDCISSHNTQMDPDYA